MPQDSYALLNLGRAFLAGSWNSKELLKRGKRACPQDRPWITKAVRRLLRVFGEHPPSLHKLIGFLRSDPKLPRVLNLSVGEYFATAPVMSPSGSAARSWQVPSLTTPGQLADWLGVPANLLDWFADVRAWSVQQPAAKLRHYVYHWQPRRRGRFRLVESPKPTLKRMQRKILRELLDVIPPHQAVHGFRRGRSVLSYAAPHAGQRIVLRFDLRDFFPSVRASRVHALFRTIGYPDEVARLLTGLCTSCVPAEVWDQRPEPQAADMALGNRLRARHLPQGAPTSPALANLCAFRLDVRLQGLAESLQATYTRYADDLAFSGGDLLARAARRFQVAVAVIAAEEGFHLHFQKSRFMRRGLCQQLAGIVVNERPNIKRGAYDELKAILTNCVRHGPISQNRAGHADFRGYLLGRIAYVQMLNPARAAKLRALFEKIVW
jgi:RNA-directed DNA polymerase